MGARVLRSFCIACSALFLTATKANAQCAGASTHVVRGRVLSSAGTPLPLARVTVQDSTKCGMLQARLDTSGLFSVHFPGGSGVYFVTSTHIGYAPQVTRTASDATESAAGNADIRLVPVSTTLDVLETVARRPRVFRDPLGLLAAPGTENVNLANGLGGATGEISNLLANLPGLDVTPTSTGGLDVSAYGLTSDENGATLNGAPAGTNSLPRDGLRKTVRLSSYDPKFGIAGVHITTFLASGTPARSLAIRLSDERPPVRTADAGVDAVTARLAKRTVGLSGAGPAVGGNTFYSTSVDIERRSWPFVSLTSASDASLNAIGLSADSVRRLENIANRIGLPLSFRNDAQTAAVDSRVAGILRVDLTPASSGDALTREGNAAYLVFAGSVSDRTAGGVSPFVALSRTNTTSHHDAQIALHYSPYFFNALSETIVAASTTTDAVSPLLAVPSASVLMDGAQGREALQLGGGGGSTSLRDWRISLSNESSWMTWNRAHRFAIYAEGSVEARAIRAEEDGAGRFEYRSLADLDAGRPSEYARSFARSTGRGSVQRVALGVSDIYQALDRARERELPFEGDGLKIQYGLRLQAERVVPGKFASASLTDSLGLPEPDNLRSISLSPMAGLTWRIGSYVERRGLATVTETRHTMTAGFREYRGILSLPGIAQGSTQTGSSEADQFLRCTGETVPAADWRGYAVNDVAAPSSCLDGQGVVLAGSLARPVLLYGTEYMPFRSRRSDLNWRWVVSPGVTTSIGANLTRNTAMAGLFDLNFTGTQRFQIENEGGRPVFAFATDIDARAGTISTGASRVLPAYSRISEVRSDLGSTQKQLIGSLEFRSQGILPRTMAARSAFAVVIGRLTYAYTDATRTFRGFGGSTAGDPRALETTVGSSSRHVIQIATSLTKDGWASVAFSARMASGLPYTPMVVGDVNGDELYNDRAFIPDVSALETTAWHNLLAATSVSARQCLRRQAGRIAGANSCHGPWTASLGTVSMTPDSYRIGLGNRGTFTLYMENVVDGIDRLVHNGNPKGWGVPTIPDHNLVTVRGFDPATRTFTYALNPRFGTSNAGALFGRTFRLILDMRVDVGPDRESVALTDFMMRAQKDHPDVDMPTLKARLLTVAGPAPWALLRSTLKFAEWLHVDTAQSDALTTLSVRATAKRDLLYESLAAGLLEQQNDLGSQRARHIWHKALRASLVMRDEYVRALRDILTPAQIAMLEARRLMPSSESTAGFARTLRQPLTQPQ